MRDGSRCFRDKEAKRSNAGEEQRLRAKWMCNARAEEGEENDERKREQGKGG
jgi:hypothetical protein